MDKTAECKADLSAFHRTLWLYANNTVWGENWAKQLLNKYMWEKKISFPSQESWSSWRWRTWSRNCCWGPSMFPFRLRICIAVTALNAEKPMTPLSLSNSLPLQVELTGSSVFDYVHPGDHVEMAEQLGMKLPPGRGLLSQGTAEDAASSASSSSQSETPEPGGNWVSMCLQLAVGG